MKAYLIILILLFCDLNVLNAQSLFADHLPVQTVQFYINEYKGIESSGSGSLIPLGKLEVFMDNTNPAPLELRNTTCLKVAFKNTAFFVSPDKREEISNTLSYMEHFDEYRYLDVKYYKVKPWFDKGWMSSDYYHSYVPPRKSMSDYPSYNIQNHLNGKPRSQEFFFSELKVGIGYLDNIRDVVQFDVTDYYLTGQEVSTLQQTDTFAKCMGYSSAAELDEFLDMHFSISKFLSDMDDKMLSRITEFPKELLDSDTYDLNNRGVGYVEGKYQAKYYFDGIYTMNALPPILREIAREQGKPLVLVFEDDPFWHPSEYLNGYAESEKEFIKENWIFAQFLPTKANLDWLKQFSIIVEATPALVIINQQGNGAAQSQSYQSDIQKMIKSLIEAQQK